MGGQVELYLAEVKVRSYRYQLQDSHFRVKASTIETAVAMAARQKINSLRALYKERGEKTPSLHEMTVHVTLVKET